MNIELKNISRGFGSVLANDQISLSVKGGQIVGVLGENGAGKSTLMKILAGYQRADSGEICLNDQPADYRTPQGAIAAGVGMLQQDPLDIPPFTVLENFIYGRKGSLALGRRSAAGALTSLARRLGFALDANAPISTLSIGQRQQLEIVRLLSLGVKTLILDEPTTGISAEQKNILFTALRDLARSDGMSVLLVSHKLEDVIALCDEVVVLRAGRIVGAAHMPVTTDYLVRLMFGGALDTQTLPTVSLGDSVLTVHDLTVRDKRVTVEHFSLTAHAGEVIGFAGLEGSGQELVLRACVGLIKPVRGRIRIGGRDLTGASYRAYRRAGVAFGAAGRLEEGLIAGLTLTEHVAVSGEQQDRRPLVDWRAARTTTESQIKRYNVRGKPADAIEQLSGGNQQRVLMALLPGAPVLIALEQPTRGLDVESARWIWTQLFDRRTAGTAILFTSPDLEELVTYSDRIFVAYAGRFFEIADAKSAAVDDLGRRIGGDFT